MFCKQFLQNTLIICIYNIYKTYQILYIQLSRNIFSKKHYSLKKYNGIFFEYNIYTYLSRIYKQRLRFLSQILNIVKK